MRGVTGAPSLEFGLNIVTKSNEISTQASTLYTTEGTGRVFGATYYANRDRMATFRGFLCGEMLDCRGGQAGRDAVAEAAADAVLPLCPVVDDAGAHGLEFAQPPIAGTAVPMVPV